MSEKPEWIRWYSKDYMSDDFVLSLPCYHWRGVYDEILYRLSIDGSIIYDELSFLQRYKKDADIEESKTILEKIRVYLSRNDPKGKILRHPKIDAQRDYYFKWKEARRLGGRKSGKVRRKLARTKLEVSGNRGGSNNSLSYSNSYSYSELTNKYNSETQLAITGAIETARKSRKTGKISDSVIGKLLEAIARYPPEAVYEGCRVYCEKHTGKSEKYLLGIIRGKAKEPAPEPEFDIDNWVPPEERKH